MELGKIQRRLDERRRRDPTFKETAVDLDRHKMLPFSKFRDYYAELGVEQFCPPAELKDAYKKMSLKLHPDKIVSRQAQERAARNPRPARPGRAIPSFAHVQNASLSARRGCRRANRPRFSIAWFLVDLRSG